MTDIGEAIAIAAVQQNPNEPCWYCEEPPVSDKKNEETADPDTSDSESEDAVPENDDDNDSSELGSSLGSKPSWTIECPDTGAATKVLAAAHHCIPGNASLKKAMDNGLRNFMDEGGPMNLASDIGYGVNHQNNGVWLPGNYSVRTGKEHYTKNWSGFAPSFKNEYAKRAMEKCGMQFHDAHRKYNGKVRGTLDSIKSKLGKPKKKCPVCEKKFDKTRPPFGLVGRLDFVSGEHRSMINNINQSDAKKFVTAGYYTSSRVKKYFGIV